jgi:hypothetical protein
MRLSSRTVIVAVALAGMPALAMAQSRRVLASGDPETQLMGYYAAVMQFAPSGFMPAGSRLEIGGDLTLIPPLSAADRTVGFGGTKQEKTNFCPVLPRLRAGASFGRTAVEAGLTPPVTVCGVKATLFSVAVAQRLPLSETWGAVVRASALAGTLDAAITCSADAIADPADRTCFGGNISQDQVKPLTFALDGAITYAGWRRHGLEPYVLLGVRRERVDFTVNYTRPNATVTLPALDDHERFRARLTRIHVAAGAAWELSARLRLGGEFFYAPGALLTVRGRASVALRSPS